MAARIDERHAGARDELDRARIESEEDIRVLTALIGCLMVADDSRPESTQLSVKRESDSEPQR